MFTVRDVCFCAFHSHYLMLYNLLRACLCQCFDRLSFLLLFSCLAPFSKATGMDAPDTGRLSHIYQLSGFADPVYAEACVTVHDYDIVLEVRKGSLGSSFRCGLGFFRSVLMFYAVIHEFAYLVSVPWDAFGLLCCMCLFRFFCVCVSSIAVDVSSSGNVIEF